MKRQRICGWTAWLAAVAILGGCGKADAPVDDDASAAVNIERWRDDVRTLASDEFEGRAPSSEGERRTVEHLVAGFKAAGLVGGNNGEFVQRVPLVAVSGEIVQGLTVDVGDATVALPTPDDAVIWSKRLSERNGIEDSPLVFVGYGAVAPEFDWNDYAGVDVSGKTVIMLVNDPGFATGDEALFTGRKMTYYGRWTYKFEEAARQGAAAAILIHEEAAAGYPWGVVQNGWTGPQFDLQSADGNAGRVAIEGWIRQEPARRLFEQLGADLDALAAQAARPGFQPVVLGGAASAAVRNTAERSESANVVAMIPGERRGETVAVTAHWDHFGHDTSVEGDGIYNGAVDNATGTAALLELARVLAEESHQRSILFVAVTAEESGLLGSAWFAEHPPVPLETMAGVINIDSMVVTGATRDVEVVGFGSSTMEDYLRRAAERQDRVLVEEATPEKGFFFRSDHFNFAKRGVPVLYAESGIDHLTGGKAYGESAAAEYISNDYHQPSDEYRESWDLSSVEADLTLYRDVIHALANTDAWPAWRAGHAFERIRLASAAARDDD